MDIKNRVAIVTGGASGLGRATSEQIIKQGGKVVIFDINEANAKQAVSELGASASYCVVNVTDEQSVQNGIRHALDTFGAIHIAVNCAGTASATRTVSKQGPHPLDIFQMIINLNLVGTFNVTRLAADQMCKQEPVNDDGERGVIVNTASIAAMDGQIGQVAYSASKGGVCSMTLTIARDLGKMGVRCCAIAPGIFDTPLMGFAPQEMRDNLAALAQFPHRLGNPREFARLAGHIIENSYLNGEVIRIDGATRMPAK